MKSCCIIERESFKHCAIQTCGILRCAIISRMEMNSIYESSPELDMKSPSSPSRKRARTAFTPQQKALLETAFLHDTLPSTAHIEALAARLNFKPKVIRTWFQNRRTYARKQNNRYASDTEEMRPSHCSNLNVYGQQASTPSSLPPPPPIPSRPLSSTAYQPSFYHPPPTGLSVRPENHLPWAPQPAHSSSWYPYNPWGSLYNPYYTPPPIPTPSYSPSYRPPRPSSSPLDEAQGWMGVTPPPNYHCALPRISPPPPPPCVAMGSSALSNWYGCP